MRKRHRAYVDIVSCTNRLKSMVIANKRLQFSEGLCTKNTSRALIERPYSCAPQAVGAVYDRPGFFVQSLSEARQNIAGTALRIGGPLTTEDVVISESGWIETVW